MSGGGISRKISDRFPADLPRVGMENGLLDTWCCRVVSLDVRPTRGLALRSLFALWPGASALNLAAIGHWSCTLVPCGTRCLGGLGVVVA